jgi:hypothetical protein
MLGRFLILVAMMLFGPLFIDVYLYHPTIVREHDPFAVAPLVASTVAVVAGFLLLAADLKVTAALFAIVCALEIAVGVAGTAIHLAMHAPTLLSLATDPNAWLGQPPVLVPLSFAAGGCMGLIPIARPEQRKLAAPPVVIARILYAMAAACGFVAALAGTQAEAGAVALIAVIAALGFGAFGYAAEIIAIVYPIIRAGFVKA